MRKVPFIVGNAYRHVASYYIGGWQWHRQAEGYWETHPERSDEYGWSVRDLDGWYLCGYGNEYRLGDSKGAAKIGVKQAIALAANAIRNHDVSPYVERPVRQDFPSDTDKLLALIPAALHDVPMSVDIGTHPACTPREAARDINQYGCRGCRVLLWETIRGIEAAEELSAAQTKGK